jgi:hypothetical protein
MHHSGSLKPQYMTVELNKHPKTPKHMRVFFSASPTNLHSTINERGATQI